MKARWIFEDPDPPGGIGMAIVASWVPGRFHKISTIEFTGESAMEKLTESLRSGKKAERGRQFFKTQIAKCDKHGFVGGSWSSPVYQKEYETLEAAKEGHKIIVALFGAGKPLPPPFSRTLF
jgi:hypothetical protein